MKDPIKQRRLVFIPYHAKYDAFISRITMNAMQKIFEDSTGIPLTKEMILQQVKANEVTLVASQKRLVGYYCYSPPWNGHMYLGSVILTPEAQGKGYGTRILRHIEQEALAKGVQILDGHVQTSNQKALSFWLYHGFRVVGHPQAGSIPIRKTLLQTN
jgi:L-amino acid N-acyltransferase YncA